MGLITDVRLRQPVDNDLVGRRFLVAGIGAGFEGTIGIRVLGPNGKVLATDSAQSSGGGIGIGEFSTRVKVKDPPRAGTRLTVQVFGDNPGLPEGPSPGFNLREAEVIMFPDMQGWLLYRVESGDTLAVIVRKLKDFTRITAKQIQAANPQKITDPDHIEVGWRLRVPIHV